MKKIILTILLILIGINILKSQEIVVPAGGNTSGTSGSVSYTIGQVFYQAVSQSEGVVRQGVQLPYEISVATSVSGSEYIELSCAIYPNPVSDYLNLTVKTDNFENLKFYLFNSSGLQLQNGKIISDKTEIQVADLPRSIYFIKVTNGNKELKTFKIIKN